MAAEVSTKQRLLNTIGPGILMAGAAVGVSHLVQATRAGADYGFALWWLLLLAIITKYPFMEFGPRYAAATGNHLIQGYRKLGKPYLFTYGFITVGTMIIIQAAVTIATAGLAEHFFGFGWSPFFWSAIILGICITVLFIGKYKALDFSMRIIISVLTICTFTAVIFALFGDVAVGAARPEPPSYWHAAGLAFIIAFMGWMPIPLDASVWHSIWSLEKARHKKYRPSLSDARLDFNIGYLAAGFIGLLFFILGALVMFGSERSFPTGSVGFAAELVAIYGETLGSWSIPVVAIAAFITMFSTTLAVTDAYPRVMMEFRGAYNVKILGESQQWQTYVITLFAVPSLALGILFFFSEQFTLLVDFAAGLSFLSAPILAWFNYRLITGEDIQPEARPGKAYAWFSTICLLFLISFSFVYLYWRLFV